MLLLSRWSAWIKQWPFKRLTSEKGHFRQNILTPLWQWSHRNTHACMFLLCPYFTQFGFVKGRQGVSCHHDDPTSVAGLPQRFSTNEGSRALNHTLFIFQLMHSGNNIYQIMDNSFFLPPPIRRMVCLMSVILLHISFTLLVNLRAWGTQANVSSSKDEKKKLFYLENLPELTCLLTVT